MRLSQFILQNLEPILQQWESFARSLKSGASMNIEALRDDAEQMLRFVAADIESDQTYGEEVHKATGHGPVLPIGESSAAHGHGIGRAVDRFSLVELVSEYRALRASVTRMWIEAVPLPDDAVAQIVRFNEALDQIAAEGVATFSERIDHDTDLFSASVGHDLANPVDVVTTRPITLPGARPFRRASGRRSSASRERRAGFRPCWRTCAISRTHAWAASSASTVRRVTLVASCTKSWTTLPRSIRAAMSLPSAVAICARMSTRDASARWSPTWPPKRCSTEPRELASP